MTLDAKALVLRHHEEIWTRGNLDAIDDLYAPDFVGHHPGAADWVGREGVREVVVRVRQAFPDFAESVEDVIVEGDKVVTRITATGTQRGPFMNAPPTGREVRFAEMAIYRLVNGRIAEKWGMIDRLGVFQQLGLTPGGEPRLEFLYETHHGSRGLRFRRDAGGTPENRARHAGRV